MGAELWAWPHDAITKLIKLRVPEFKCNLSLGEFIQQNLNRINKSGWWVIGPRGAATAIEANELPECVAFDVESTKEHNQPNKLSGDNDYHPFLAVCYGIPSDGEKPFWYIWVGPNDNSQRLIEMPKDRIIITFNGGVHDSKYLSCEYEGEPLPIIHVDVMALLTMYRGICDDKQQAVYQKYSANKRAGKSAPEWFGHVTSVSLKEAAANILGIPIVKGIDQTDMLAPQDVIQYCAQDVSLTVQLLQRVYPILDQFISSPATWVGMAASMGLSVYLDDAWPQHCDLMRVSAEASERKTVKAWLSYHQHEYAKLYINDGAAKVGINPVGDPLSRFPKSGVWCHGHSDVLPAFAASAEEGGFACDVHLVIPENLQHSDPGFPKSKLLDVRMPESIEFESDKRKYALSAEYGIQSLATDLLHAALTIIHYEIMHRGLDARVCDFRRTDDDLVIGIMGDDKDADELRGIADTAQELCYALCDEVAEVLGVPF